MLDRHHRGHGNGTRDNVKPSTLRNMMQNYRVIEVWNTLDGPLVDIVVNCTLDHVETVEQQNGNVAVLGSGWAQLCGPTDEISNRVAYDMMNAPGYYVRLPHPDVKRNTFVVAYHPAV